MPADLRSPHTAPSSAPRSGQRSCADGADRVRIPATLSVSPRVPQRTGRSAAWPRCPMRLNGLTTFGWGPRSWEKISPGNRVKLGGRRAPGDCLSASVDDHSIRHLPRSSRSWPVQLRIRKVLNRAVGSRPEKSAQPPTKRKGYGGRRSAAASLPVSGGLNRLSPRARALGPAVAQTWCLVSSAKGLTEAARPRFKRWIGRLPPDPSAQCTLVRVGVTLPDQLTGAVLRSAKSK